MREILFRGFHPDESGEQKVFVNGEWVKGYWVYGYYASKKETTYAIEEDYKRYPVKTEHFIIVEQMTDWGLPNKFLLYPVIPETVGQYTGLQDKNGKKIFEGDIVKRQIGDYSVLTYYYTVDFKFGEFELSETRSRSALFIAYVKSSELCGNIFENPELRREAK